MGDIIGKQKETKTKNEKEESCCRIIHAT